MLRSLPHLVWMLVFTGINVVYIPLREEPGLERRFGDAYQRYRANVPRFVPRMSPWQGYGGGRHPAPDRARARCRRRGGAARDPHPAGRPALAACSMCSAARERSARRPTYWRTTRPTASRDRRRADPVALARFDQAAFAALPEGFEAIELSPVAPLAASSALATVHQNKALASIRSVEVLSDATNVLARRVRAARQALLRANPVGRARAAGGEPPASAHAGVRSDPNFSAHFRLFALCSAGARHSRDVRFHPSALDAHTCASTRGSRASSWGPSSRLQIALTDLASADPQSSGAATYPGVDVSVRPERASRAAATTARCASRSTRVRERAAEWLEARRRRLGGLDRRSSSRTRRSAWSSAASRASAPAHWSALLRRELARRDRHCRPLARSPRGPCSRTGRRRTSATRNARARRSSKREPSRSDPDLAALFEAAVRVVATQKCVNVDVLRFPACAHAGIAPMAPDFAEGALRGVRVLDLSRVIAGPYVGRLFCDLGAEVIKVEAARGRRLA